MAITHSTVATLPDEAGKEINKAEWNADHVIAAGTITTTELGGDITTAGKAILDDADATAQRATLGLVIGTNVQAFDAGLSDISGLAVTDGNIIVGDGANWVAESGATARTSLGLGTGDSPQFTGIELGHATDTTLTRSSAGNVAVEGNVVYRAGGTDVPVADGGTGASTAPDARANLLAGYGIEITSALGASNPGDGATLYTGALGLSATEGVNKVRIHRAGTIKRVYLIVVVTGTLGSGETSTWSLRLNGTTDTTITSAFTASSLTNEFSNTSLSIAVAAGDYFELKWVTPTWATNPTGVYTAAQIYVE